MDLTRTLLEMFWVITMFAVPVLTVWGWVRWTRSTQPRTFSSTASLIAFCFSTASAALAFVTWVLALTKGFRFYDPLLLTIYGFGLVLSLIAFLFSLAGVWRPNLLRWHAPLCAMGTLLFWFIAVEAE